MFTGTTTEAYTQGRYYLCVNDGGTYTWTDVTASEDVTLTANRAVVSD